VIAVDKLDPVSLESQPQKNSYLGLKPTMWVFGYPVMFVDFKEKLIKLESVYDKRRPLKLPIDDRGNPDVESINRISLRFVFFEEQYTFAYFSFMDMLSELGGIGAMIQAALGKAAVLLVLLYIVDMIRFIRQKNEYYHDKVAITDYMSRLMQYKHVVTNFLQHEAYYQKQAELMKEVRANSRLSFNRKDLKSDLHEILELIKIKHKREKPLAQEDRGDSSDSDDDVDDLTEEILGQKQLIERLGAIDRKYARFRVADKGLVEWGGPPQTETLFDETNVLMRIMKYRVSLDFFEISDFVKKRISFFGIYEAHDRVELNTYRLKNLRVQVRHLTRQLLRGQHELRLLLAGAPPAAKVDPVVEEPP
jgi:hypothetical protein